MYNEEKGCVTINMKCCGNGGGEAAAPSIGENGNWFIGDQDTGITAQGPAGEAGSKGDQGERGPQGSAGAPGLFSAMEIIFDGTAGEKGKTYDLLKPVTDYKILIAETKAYSIPKSSWLMRYAVIPVPEISNMISQYGYFIHRGLEELEVNKNATVSWHFPTAYSMIIDTIQVIPDHVIDSRVTKIYGIK